MVDKDKLKASVKANKHLLALKRVGKSLAKHEKNVKKFANKVSDKNASKESIRPVAVKLMGLVRATGKQVDKAMDIPVLTGDVNEEMTAILTCVHKIEAQFDHALSGTSAAAASRLPDLATNLVVELIPKLQKFRTGSLQKHIAQLTEKAAESRSQVADNAVEVCEGGDSTSNPINVTVAKVALLQMKLGRLHARTSDITGVAEDLCEQMDSLSDCVKNQAHTLQATGEKVTIAARGEHQIFKFIVLPRHQRTKGCGETSQRGEYGSSEQVQHGRDE